MAILAFLRLNKLLRLHALVYISDVKIFRILHIQVLHDVAPLEASEGRLHLGLISHYHV